MTGTKRRWQK